LRIIFWILRALAILLVIRLVLRGLFGSRPAAPRPGPTPGRAPERIGGDLVQDPVCGTYIPKSRAIVVGSGDSARYFCSPECRDKYQGVTE